MSSTAAVQGARGGGITAAGSLVSLVLQLVSVTVLSRLLSPDDFGVVAMVLAFVALGELLRDFGIPTVALQKRDLSAQQASNLFWLNAMMAFAVAAALALSAPAIAGLYAEPRLHGVVPALAVTLFLNGVAGQIRVQLARRLRFRTLVACDLSAKVLALVLAVVLALAGFGYWALVAQSVFAAAFLLGSQWVSSRWLPRPLRRGHGLRGMVQSGMEYWLAYFLGYLQDNAATLIIGRLLGAGPLGIYNRGSQLVTAPAGAVLTPLTQVVIPTLNRAVADGGSFGRMLRRIQVALATVAVCALAAAASTADALIPLALGDGWEAVVPVFQFLAVAGSFQVLSHVSYWAFVYKGRSRSLLRYNLVSKPIAIACIGVGAVLGGVVGAAAGYALGRALGWPLNLAWLASDDDFPARSLAVSGTTILVAGTLGALVTHRLVTVQGGFGDAAVVGLGVPFAVVLTLGVLLLLPHTRRELLAGVGMMRTIVRTWRRG